MKRIPDAVMYKIHSGIKAFNLPGFTRPLTSSPRKSCSLEGMLNQLPKFYDSETPGLELIFCVLPSNIKFFPTLPTQQHAKAQERNDL